MPSGALSQALGGLRPGRGIRAPRARLTEPAPYGRVAGVLPWRGFSVKEAGTIVQGTPVPTLIRFLVIVLVLGGLAFGAMYALATFVEPQPRDMTTTIPNSRLPAR